MNITVYGLVKQIPLQTISLGKDTKNPDNAHLFHCFYCGQSIVQIQGRVDKVFPGLEPTSDVVAIYKCSQCRRNYTFQTHNYNYKNITRVVLTNQDGIVNTFHCYICRTPLIQFKDDMIITVENTTKKVIPFEYTCPKSDCGKKYSFVDVV